MAVTLKTTDEINKMRQAGQIAAQVQSILRTHSVPGTTTRELDELADEYLKQHGAKRYLTKFYSPHISVSGFYPPPTMYISLNDEILNGMPSTYPLQQGDVVKLDITVGLNDWWATTAMTVPSVRSIEKHDGSFKQQNMPCLRALRRRGRAIAYKILVKRYNSLLKRTAFH